jgi:hypothetical protein
MRNKEKRMIQELNEKHLEILARRQGAGEHENRGEKGENGEQGDRRTGEQGEKWE